MLSKEKQENNKKSIYVRNLSNKQIFVINEIIKSA